LEIPEEFESERLLIRAPRAGDGATIAQAVNESLDDLRDWLPWAQAPVAAEEQEVRVREARVKWELRTDLMVLLCEKSSGAYVGGSGLHRMDWSVPRFEIGSWQRSRFRGRGYVTAAVHRITRFAEETLRAKRVEI